MDSNAATSPILREDEICGLIALKEERQHFDFKGPMRWDESTRDAIDLVKDILALANSGGGHLVIGVAEDSGTFNLVGLADDEIATWESTRLGNKVRVYSDPPVGVRVRIVECGTERFAVITVDGFQRVPHICKKTVDRDGKRILTEMTLYVRTVACESRPVQTADELNEIIERAVRTRQDQMLTAMRSAMIGASTTTGADDRSSFNQQITEALQESAEPLPDKSYDAFYTDVMFPSRFEEDRFSRAQLKDALSAASVIYEGWPLLLYEGSEKFITTLPDGLRLQYAGSHVGLTGAPDDRYFYWRLRRSGLLVAKSLAWEDTYFSTTCERRIYKRSIVVHIAQSIDALVRLYSQLGMTDEDVTWIFELSGTRNRRLADPPNNNIAPYPGQNPTTSEPIVQYRQTRSIEEWRTGKLDHIVEATRDIFEQFGAPFVNYADIKEQARKHLRLPS
jgi:hypothetical protein